MALRSVSRTYEACPDLIFQTHFYSPEAVRNSLKTRRAPKLVCAIAGQVEVGGGRRGVWMLKSDAPGQLA